MATRSIVTSQPDIACDVCERRLLRGEQWDMFLAAGQRRTVCELCAPRATNAGWQREADHDPVDMAPARPRRRRGLFGRLRQTARPARDSSPRQDGPGDRLEPDESVEGEVEPPERSRARPVAASRRVGQAAGPREPEPRPQADLLLGDDLDTAGQDGRAERAVAAFNACEHPRRVSGLSRSLGSPSVNVRPDEEVQHLVAIVVAWELCWYRYEVDVDEEDPVVRMVDQGTELDEIAAPDRLPNAAADELGELSLSA